MASTPSDRLGLRLIGTGDFQDTWGSSLNSDALSLIDEGIAGVETIALSGDVTLSTTQYVSNQSRNRVLRFTNNSLSGTPTVTLPSTERFYIIHNALGGTYGITFSNGSATVSVAANITTALIWQTGSVLYGIDLATGTDVATVAPQITNNNLQTVAGQIAPTNNIGTLAGINADITTVATPAYKALVEVVGEATYKALVEVVGESGYKAFVETVGNATYKALVETVGNATYKALVETVGETNYKAVVEVVGNATYKALVEVVGESVYKGKVETVADATYKSQIEDLNDATYKAQLQDIATSPYKPLIQTVGNATYKALVEVVGESTYKALVETVGNATYKALVEVVGESVYKGKVETVGNTSNMASVNTVANGMTSIGDFAKVYQVSTNNPTARGNGDTPLLAGDLAYVTSSNKLRTYNATLGAWEDAGSSVSGLRQIYQYVATANQTVFPASGSISYDQTAGGAAISIFLNGVLLKTTDYTATNGTSVTLATGAALNDEVTIHTFGTFNAANTYSQSETNTLLAAKATTTDLATTNATVATKAPLASPNFTGTPQIGGSNILTSATAPASGGTADFVAQGNLTNGMTVGLRADGKVEPIVGVSEGDGNSTASSIAISSSAYRTVSSCYDETNDKTIISYADGSDIKAVVCTVTDNTLTFGTPVTVTSSNGGFLNTVCHDPTKDRLVFAYSSTISNNNCARVGQLSGTGLNSITVGAETTFANTASNLGPMTSVFQKRRAGPADVNYVIITWHKNTSNYLIAAAVEINASANTCTVYPTVDIRSANTANHDTAYFDDDQRIVASYVEPSNTYNLQVRDYSLNANLNSFTIGSGFEVDTGTWSETQVMADPLGNDDRGFLFARESQNTGYTHCWAIRCFGGSISKGTGVVVNSGDNAFRIGAASNGKNKAVLFYTLLSGGTAVKSVVVSRSSSTITAGTPATFQSYDGQQNVTHYDPDANTFISISRNPTGGIVTAKTFAEEGSNNTSFIGISDAVTSSGSTGSVKVFSGIKTGLSSLTPNSIYYVQADGTISTTSTSPAVKIGRALSTTSLQLTEANT